MRSHKQIITDAGGAESVSAAFGLSIHTVRSWVQRDSIPSEHWAEIARNEWASLEELAEAAERRRVTDLRSAHA